MIRRALLPLLVPSACAALAVACSSSNSSNGGTPDDAGPASDSGYDSASSVTPDAGPSSDSGEPTTDSGLTTIAAAISGNVTSTITVNAIVTAEHGAIPNDVSEWYIEDLDGGPNSGVVVYCDPDKTACPATIRAPAIWTLVQLTGKLSPYKGQNEFIPTALTILSDAGAGTPPPVPSVTMADVAPTGKSTYRGVLVKLTAAKLTVDNVTPSALLDTSCTSVIAPDGGAWDAGAEGGLASCATPCEPPAYSGFTANDGNGNEVNIEASFFATDPLQSSPECLTQPGVTPVLVGTTFSSMQGVLDFDPYAGQQQLSPVTPADYATP
jgi:hypothetical protein